METVGDGPFLLDVFIGNLAPKAEGKCTTEGAVEVESAIFILAKAIRQDDS